MKDGSTNRVIKVIAGVLLISIILGCGEEPSKDTSKMDTAGTVQKDLGEYKIGVSMYTLGAPYFAAQLNAAKRKARSLGITIFSTNAQDDMVKQLADVEDLLARGIDLLILNPKDPQGLIPATKAASKAGVPVIIIDSSIDPSADFVTTVQSNNLRNGELIGEWLVKQMKGEPIRMALISGVQGNPVGKERRQGVFRGIIEQQLRTKGTSFFTIVAQGWGNWTHEGGLKAMEDILVAHPDINVLFGENDSMTLGAIEAVKEAGKMNDILILAAADGQKEALKLIRSGEYGATGSNNPVLIAETAIDIGLEVLQGKTGFPQKSYTPAVCITKENVDAYYDPDSEF
jgi:ribose transport system substrate-binding protein